MSQITATAWGLIKKWDKENKNGKVSNTERPKSKVVLG